MDKVELLVDFISEYINIQETGLRLDNYALESGFKRSYVKSEEYLISDSITLILDTGYIRLSIRNEGTWGLGNHHQEHTKYQLDDILKVIVDVFLSSEDIFTYTYKLVDIFNENIIELQIKEDIDEPYYDPICGKTIGGCINE